MVELFAISRLTRFPDQSNPVVVVTNDELPTPAKLSGPMEAQNPLDGIYTRFETSRPCPQTATSKSETGLVSFALVRPSQEGDGNELYRIERRDYSPGNPFP